MKIRELTAEQKKHFKDSVPLFFSFLKINAPQLSHCSMTLYARAISYIAVENTLYMKTPKELALDLTKQILTTSDFEKIVGKDTNGNQNIRLSAFRNLVTPFKDELQSEISEVSYSTLTKLLSRKGTHIRKNLLESKTKNLKDETELMASRSWKQLQDILKNVNQKYRYIVNKFLKTNEIPDYVTLRNILIINLYVNNHHCFKNMKTYCILRNEYRTAYLWISGEEPPKNKNNYFWLNFETNQHFIIVQNGKTVNGNLSRKMFKLNPAIANMMTFIKQTFNENIDKPFFKNNTREEMPTGPQWVRIVGAIFVELSPHIKTSTIRKIYYNEIDWKKLTKDQMLYITSNMDFSERNLPTKFDGIHQNNSELPFSPLEPMGNFSSDEVVVF